MGPLLESIKGTINNWWVYLLAGILFIVTGIIVFCDPKASFISIALLFGILLFVVGIMQTVVAVSSRDIIRGWGWDLAFGIIDIILGVYFICNLTITVIALPFIFGFWLMLKGFYLFAFAFQLKDIEVKGWGWILTGAILTIILSLLVIFHPFSGALVIVYLVGITFLVIGIFYLMLSFRLRSLKKEIAKLKS